MNFCKTFSVCLSFILWFNASGSENVDGEKILRKAALKLDGIKTIYKEGFLDSPQGKIQIIFYRRVNSDGTVDIRQETSLSSIKFKEVEIRNQSGHWLFSNKTALKINYDDERSFSEPDYAYLLPIINSKPVSYEAYETNLNDNVCAIIKVELSKDTWSKVYNSRDSKSMAALQRIQKTMPEKLPKYIVYTVNKSEYLIYSEMQILSDGSIKRGFEYQTIQINPELKNDLFEIPRNLEVIKVSSSDDLSEAKARIIDEQAGRKPITFTDVGDSRKVSKFGIYYVFFVVISFGCFLAYAYKSRSKKLE